MLPVSCYLTITAVEEECTDIKEINQGLSCRTDTSQYVGKGRKKRKLTETERGKQGYRVWGLIRHTVTVLDLE